MVGVVAAMPSGHFGLTPLGQKLTSNTAGSMRDVAIALTAPAHWLPWGRLIDAIRQGTPETQSALGRELFQYYAENADEGRAFTGAMSHASGLVAEEVAHLLDTSNGRLTAWIGRHAGVRKPAQNLPSGLQQNPRRQFLESDPATSGNASTGFCSPAALQLRGHV
jgi:hypothetical protein